MSIFAHLRRCLELSEKDITSALADRRLAKALVDQLSRVSKPNDGSPKLLLVFARLATQNCEWIDGALRVDMIADGDTTRVEVLTDLGLGMSERVFPSFVMRVPLEEFSRAVERVPHMIEPLTIATKTAKKMSLTASEETRRNSAPPMAVEIADDSLYSGSRIAPAAKMPRTRSSGSMSAVRPEKAASKHPALRKSVPPKMDEVKVTTKSVPPKKKTSHPPPPSTRGAPQVRVVPKAPPLPQIAKIAPTPPRGGPPPVPQKAGARGSKPPPPKTKTPSIRPKPIRPKRSDPPDEESIDRGWGEDGED
jgi:hypothetical protein